MLKRIGILAFCLASFAMGADIAGQLAALKKLEYGHDRKLVYELRQTVYHASKSTDSRQAMQKRLLALLNDGQSTYMCKKTICHEFLPVLADNSAVPTLAKMLGDEKTALLALDTLRFIKSDASLSAVRSSLASGSKATQTMAANVLGARRDAKAVSSLAKLAKSSDTDLKNATLNALAAIGTRKAAATVLANADAKSSAGLDALLTLAAARCSAKDTVTAKTIYDKLIKGAPKHARLAAIMSMGRQLKGQAAPQLLALFKSEEGPTGALALRMALKFGGKDAIVALRTALASVSTAKKVAALTELGASGNTAGADLAAAMATDGDEAVRLAAIAAIGKLGNAAHLDVLVKRALTGSREKAAVVAALGKITDPKLDPKILASLKTCPPQQRSILINAIVARRSKGWEDGLKSILSSKGESLRKDVYKGLKGLVENGNEALSIDFLKAAKTDIEHRYAKSALQKLATVTTDKPRMAQMLLPILTSGTDAQKSVAVDVAPLLGGADLLKAVIAAVKGGGELGGTAVRALGLWPDASAVETLKSLAAKATDERSRRLATMGLCRLLAVSQDPGTTATVLLPLLKTVDEKRLLVSSMAKSAPSTRLLELAAKMIEDPQVKAEAAFAAAELLKKLSNANPKLQLEVIAAIEKSKPPRSVARDIARLKKKLGATKKQMETDAKILAPQGFRIVARLNCGEQKETGNGKISIKQLSGTNYAFPNAPSPQGTVAYGDEVQLEVTGMASGKDYAIGFTVWDVDNGKRVQSVHIANGSGGWQTLMPPSPPMSYDGGKPSWARVVLPVPRKLLGKTVKVAFRKHAGANAVVSELWIAEKTDTVKRKRVALVVGDDYRGHVWRATGPKLMDILQADPRLEVYWMASPWVHGSPVLDDFDATVMHFQTQKLMPKADILRKMLSRVENGQGLVLVHFACGCWQPFKNEFIKAAGRVWNPKFRGHDPWGKFMVKIIDKKHPITSTINDFETMDELYSCLDGKEDVHVLANAKSKKDKKIYPMAFVRQYGKGRIFHSPLGHNTKGFEAQGVKDLFRRGTDWTLGIECK